jgi:hypothetical protein
LVPLSGNAGIAVGWMFAELATCDVAPAQGVETVSRVNIDPALRQAAESVLHKNESLSEFVAAALRAGIARRRFQDGFISRGLA